MWSFVSVSLFIHVSFLWEVPFIHLDRVYVVAMDTADISEDGQAKLMFKRFPPAAWGSYAQTHQSMHLSTRAHTAHVLPILLHSSSVSFCHSSIFLDTLLQHWCALLTPASQVAQLPRGCLKWCNMDMIIWAKVGLNHAKNKKCYCKMMQPGGEYSGMVSSIHSCKSEFKPPQPHTMLCCTDVGGLVFSLYVYTLAYRCWEPSSVCDSPRHFKDSSNQRDMDGWGM